MQIIENELETFNQYLINCVCDESNKISADISDYLCSKSKRIRPTFVLLFAKALGIEIIYKIIP